MMMRKKERKKESAGSDERCRWILFLFNGFIFILIAGEKGHIPYSHIFLPPLTRALRRFFFIQARLI